MAPSLTPRRHHRHGIVGGVMVVLVGALVIPVIADRDGGAERNIVAGDQPTTAVEPEETTSSEVPISAETSTTTTAPPQTTPTTQAPRTTTSLACRNSTDPRCGDFRWDPEPEPNAPMTIEITASDDHQLVVGEPVYFVVRTRDPDAGPIVIDSCASSASFGDAAAPRCVPLCDNQRYGPWTPPSRTPGELDVGYEHSYARPGTYTFTAWRLSAGVCSGNPYASTQEASYTVTVSE